MAKPTYYELLKHPKWQKKRLEILERASFQCEDCGTCDVTLHVHHSYYEKGLAPWEYPNDSLHCLCEECHKRAQDLLTLLNRQIGKIDPSYIGRLLGYTMGIEAYWAPGAVLTVYSHEVAAGIGDVWGLEAEEIIDASVDGQIDGHKLATLFEAMKKRRVWMRGAPGI